MNKEHIVELLKALGADNITPTETWVNCCCPLAPWTHEYGEDTHPSFGISISDTKQSYFRCFSCAAEGKPLEDLIHRIHSLSGFYPYEAARVVLDREYTPGDIPVIHNVLDKWVPKEVQPSDLPSGVLDHFPHIIDIDKFGIIEKCAALDYLRGRGIADAVIAKYGVRYFPTTGGLVFPFTTADGSIKVLRYRSTANTDYRRTVTSDFIGMEKVPFPSISGTGAMFGSAIVNWASPVIICEGEIDVLRLASLGWTNAVATGSASFTKSQVNSICSTTVIVGFDADKGGRKAAIRFDNMTGNSFLKFFADWGIVGAKDPGDLKTVSDVSVVIKNVSAIPYGVYTHVASCF